MLTHVLIGLLVPAVAYFYRPYLTPYLRLMWPPWLAPLVGEAMSRLEDNRNAVAIVGHPIRHSWLVDGFLQNYDGESGEAQIKIRIKGSKQSGILNARLGRVDGTWVFSELQLAVANGAAINLLESADDPPRDKVVIDKRLYLVPIGKVDDVTLKDLPEFYKKNFGLDVVVSAPIALEDWVRNTKRRQLIAEEIVSLMRRRLPHLVQDAKAVMIGITDEDMYFCERNWRFTYTYWDGDRGGAVSSARLGSTQEEDTDSLLNARVRKMISRVIGMLVLKMPRSEDPSSVLAKELYGSFSADLMSDNFDGLGSLAVVDDFKTAHWLPALTPKVLPAAQNFDEKAVDGRYPCLLFRRTRVTNAGAGMWTTSITRCLPHSLIDVEVDELEIDLRTGLVMTRETDLFVGGATPLAATRCYRLWDEHSRAFGYSTALSWDMFPTGKRNPYTEVDLNLCDGRRIHFDRISEGSSYMNALFEHRRTATSFLRARFGWNGRGWDLTRTDGSHMFFPESYNAKRGVDGALVGFISATGEALIVQRGKGRNLERVSTTNGQFIKFEYDSRNRIIKAHDSQDRMIHYAYDLTGRLVQVRTPESARRYFYDGTYLLGVHEDEQPLFKLQYIKGRIGQASLGGGHTYGFRYDYDPKDNYTVVRTYLQEPNGTVTKFNIKPE